MLARSGHTAEDRSLGVCRNERRTTDRPKASMKRSTARRLAAAGAKNSR